MAERPILFSGEMVRAILEGRKTQTRRVIKPQPSGGVRWNAVVLNGYGGWTDGHGAPLRCPYGQPGDKLWVRETIYEYEYGVWCYRADGEYVRCDPADKGKMLAWAHHKKTRSCSSIHMPRWASRITRVITEIRAERVQDISEADAMAEGVSVSHYYCEEPTDKHEGLHRCDPIGKFRTLWDSINAKRGYPWDDNLWVWAISFKAEG